MATYVARDALRLPAASLLANSGLCVNIEIEIWLLLGVNVATALILTSHSTHYTVGHIGDESFQTISCTCTDLKFSSPCYSTSQNCYKIR